MTTYAQLKAAISDDINDPSNLVFIDAIVGDMANEAFVEVGYIVPREFQEDITPIADTLAYDLQQSVFADPVQAIRVRQVELWDASETPDQFLRMFVPRSTGYASTSAAGWDVWNGVLAITNNQESIIDVTKHIIRVWGYSPYPPLTSDAQVLGVSNEIEKAVRIYCRVLALRRLVNQRDLFTQWQTTASASDVSPASLMSALGQAEDEWRRRARRLQTLFEAP